MNVAIYTMMLLLFATGYDNIKLNNGRYEDVFIVIQDSVPESDQLLARMQTVLTEASKVLFEATKRRAYFGNVTIIIPNNWERKPEYTSTPSLATPGAHITIQEGLNKNPHVRHSGVCGKEGQYMYLQPSFILEEGRTNWGTHANVIVHEWGHLRWGLFDEYPTIPVTNTNNVQQFYQKDGEWKPVRCTEAISGTVRSDCNSELAISCDISVTTKLMPTHCNFCVDHKQNANASLMGYQLIDKLSSFCEEDDPSVDEDLRHNRQAPNDQNVYCHRESAWEVMEKNSDFYGGVNPSLSDDTDTTPHFVFLHETSAYIVLVLDVSGSMQGKRLSNLYQTCKFIINVKVQDYSWVGIVWFHTYAIIKQEMIQISSQQDRDGLIASLPTSTYDSTCIGCGITRAVTVLMKKLDNPQNGQIVVVSDGRDNTGDLNEGKQTAIDAKVVVHTIAISQAADSRLESIATEPTLI